MLLGKRPRTRRQLDRPLAFEKMEARLPMAASVGWDGPGLGSARLTYNIANTPSSLSQGETRAAIEKAFAVWSSVANVVFTPTSQRGLRDSIDISFTRIDGAGRTLAQAYFPDDVNPPRIAGDIQFDSSESWEVGNAKGSRAFDLVWVAVHEIGHSLGLDHINARDAVLAPSASPNQQFTRLSKADVAAIQRLYARTNGTNSNAKGIVATSNLSTASRLNDFPIDEPTDAGGADDRHFPWSRWRRDGNGNLVGDRLLADRPADRKPNALSEDRDPRNTSPLDLLQTINQAKRSGAGDRLDACATDALFADLGRNVLSGSIAKRSI